MTTLPQTRSTWDNAVRKYHLQHMTIYDFDSARSASQMDMEQYILLRAIWPTVQRATDLQSPELRKLWFSEQHYQQAKQLLETVKGWKIYLSRLGTIMTRLTPSTTVPQDMGTFSLVYYYQSLVEMDTGAEHTMLDRKVEYTPVSSRTRQGSSRDQETPRRPNRDIDSLSNAFSAIDMARTAPDSPAADAEIAGRKPVIDEQIVNTSLILFLNAITMHLAQVKASWTLHRRQFVLPKAKERKNFTARVDGYLRRQGSNTVRAIIEVKPYSREFKPDSIGMQEAAQIACWICAQPPPNRSPSKVHHRLLVSQDRAAIYLSFAEFDGRYVDYICGKDRGNSATPSLLKIRQFGPFNVTEPAAMTGLAALMLAYTMALPEQES